MTAARSNAAPVDIAVAAPPAVRRFVGADESYNPSILTVGPGTRVGHYVIQACSARAAWARSIVLTILGLVATSHWFARRGQNDRHGSSDSRAKLAQSLRSIIRTSSRSLTEEAGRPFMTMELLEGQS
jgi:hypothetical protein